MLDDFVERQTRTIRGNQILIALRLLLATAALAVLLIQEIQAVRAASPLVFTRPPLYFRPPAVVAIIVCVLSVLYLLAARPRAAAEERAAGGLSAARAPKLALIQIFVDVFLISVLIWHTGGVDSQFVVLYLVSVCSAALVLKWNVAVMAAAASTILFSTVTLLYSVDIIPEYFKVQASPAQLSRLHNLGILDFVRLLLLPVCAFFLTGFLAGALSQRLALARLVHDEILEGIGEGIVVVDAECRTLYHNREFQRLLGLSAGVQREPLEKLLGPALGQQARAVLTDLVPRRIEINHRRGDGNALPFEVRIVPMLGLDAQAARGLIIALDDITAEKKMEELLQHRQRIETMGAISATIAHEIRNPLASICGAVQELSRSLTLPEGKKVLLDIVRSESDRLNQIINDFLKFARMRPPRLVPTDLGRVLSDVKLLLSARPEAAETRIMLSGDEGDPFPADAEQLRQVFLNLGVNALQAMNGSARRELSMRVRVVHLHRAEGFPEEQLLARVDRPGVQVDIADTGPGISPLVLSQIFEPFFTTKAAGTGLGLAVVDRIVQAHEGVITVRSKEGEGTTFRIWLPTNLTAAPAHISGLRPLVGDSLPVAQPSANAGISVPIAGRSLTKLNI